MKFTLERLTLIRMMRYVARKSPSRKRRDKVVSLSACGCLVFAQGNGRAVATEGLVLQEGTSWLVPATLLRWLSRRAHKANVTFEADACVFRLDGGNWPIARFSGSATAPHEYKFLGRAGGSLRPGPAGGRKR